jgi:hypothetical protein
MEDANIIQPNPGSIRSELLPQQGRTSETYLVTDENTGKKYIRKLVDFEKAERYGGTTLDERVEAMRRIYKALCDMFEGRVVETQFEVVDIPGTRKIEVKHPYIEGNRPNLPVDVENVRNYILEKSGKVDKRKKRIQKQAKVSGYAADMAAYEITAITNWIKDAETGEYILIDF